MLQPRLRSANGLAKAAALQSFALLKEKKCLGICDLLFVDLIVALHRLAGRAGGRKEGRKAGRKEASASQSFLSLRVVG